jgi:5S rRNA maturation endonuclease (ribonuclease M5)
MSKDNQVQLLKIRIISIESLESNYNMHALQQWKEEILMILDQLIEPGSRYYKNFEEIEYSTSVFLLRDFDGKNEILKQRAYKHGLSRARTSLNAIVFGLENNLL